MINCRALAEMRVSRLQEQLRFFNSQPTINHPFIFTMSTYRATVLAPKAHTCVPPPGKFPSVFGAHSRRSVNLPFTSENNKHRGF